MQHNNWKRDQELLVEALNEALQWADDDAYGSNPTPGLDSGKTVGGESIVGRLEKLVERLEELSHTFDDTRESHEEWAQIITGIKELIPLL